MRITILILFLFLINTGCHNKIKSDKDEVFAYYTGKSVQRKNDTLFYPYKGTTYRVVIDSFFDMKTIRKISGYMANDPQPYGPYFMFDDFGKLDKFYFMAGDGEHDLYDISLNLAKSRYEEKGNAYVDYVRPYNENDSGNIFTFIFSTFPRKDLHVSYSKDKIHFEELSLPAKDTLPYIVDGRIALSKNEITQGIYIKVKATNLRLELNGLKDQKETIDTVYFK